MHTILQSFPSHLWNWTIQLLCWPILPLFVPMRWLLDAALRTGLWPVLKRRSLKHLGTLTAYQPWHPTFSTKEGVSDAVMFSASDALLICCLLLLCSYFPMYPPPAGTLLDTSLAAALDLPCSPDILIVPSDLAAFAKLIPVRQTLDFDASEDGKTVCINPGRLTKAVSGA